VGLGDKVGLAPTLNMKKYFISIDASNNRSRGYLLRLSNNQVERRWGKVFETNNSWLVKNNKWNGIEVKTFNSGNDAYIHFSKQCDRRIKRGYKQINRIIEYKYFQLRLS